MQPNQPYGPNPNQVPNTPPQPYVQGPQPLQAPTHQPSDYDFIMSPQKAKGPGLKLPGAGSIIGRIALVVVGLIVLLMIFTILKSVFNRKPDLTPFVGIMQDQQQVILIATDAAGQTAITQDDKNIALTAKLTVNTDQKKVYNYLTGNGVKFNEKAFPTLLNARVDSRITSQLATAATNSTYDTTFRSAMQQKLTTYMQDLKQVYTANKGPVGRGILNDNYNNAEKLLKQLNQAGSQQNP
ncbi:MAG TPA: hypothetical protein VF401_02665 [Candidatus Saccharimonadales bacterium]